MEKEASLSPFNASSVKEERGAFEKALCARFRPDTVREVLETLEKMQIPLPADDTQYLASQEGLLIFSNRHGVMLRIEREWGLIPDDEGFSVGVAVRANDSAWMLQPLGTVKAGEAVVEIVPGVHYEPRDAESRKLYWKMWADGYTYWDDRVDNIGRLPKLPGLPGPDVRVIIDRLAAQQLKSGATAAARALEVLKGEKNLYKYRSPIRVEPSPNADLRQEWDQMVEELLKRKPSLGGATKYDIAGYEAFVRDHKTFWPPEQEAPVFAMPDDQRLALRRAIALLTEDMQQNNTKSRDEMGKDDPQEILYGTLKTAFQEAWDTPAKMSNFWDKVLAAKEEGRLVAGWNEMESAGPHNKTGMAKKAASAYEDLSLRIGADGKTLAMPRPQSSLP